MSEVDDLVDILVKTRGCKLLADKGRQWAPVIESLTLGVIVLLAFCIRLFAVIRFEAVIHEFDPHFNWRTTEYLAEHGFVEFWNWFDNFTWYPLGRVVGNTLFPGLMTTSTLINWCLNGIGLRISVLETCVFFAPLFAGFTSIAAYLLTKEVTNRPESGLFAALFMAICPSYLSRSVAGSYDNEACAIFAIVFSFYAFTMAVKSGSILWGLFAAFAFLYMVASWGGYIFVLNTIAIYMVLVLLIGTFSARHYVAYSLFYVIGTILCLNIPFVNFQAVSSSEHLASHGVFLVMNCYYGTRFVSQYFSRRLFYFLMKLSAVGVASCFLVLVAYLTVTGKTNWSGRSLSLLDPTYAKKYIPIIASVSEHQPSTWANYVMDLHILPFLLPVGIFFCFRWASDASLILGIYGVVAVYFSGMMIRLLLVLSAAACCLGGVAASEILSSLLPQLRHKATWDGSAVRSALGLQRFEKNAETGSVKKIGEKESFGSSDKNGDSNHENDSAESAEAPSACSSSPSFHSTSKLITIIGTSFLFYLLKNFVQHCTWMSAAAYSNPSVVMEHRDPRSGTRIIQDDFREAYYWIRQNTHQKATIASWWDYGYQITSLANRTVIVDNNTWNNTHIATIGLMLGSNEKDAFMILDRLDVDYVLVLSGGVARYASDDIAKFLWPVRIANGVYPDKIAESDFIGMHGYSVDYMATEKFKNSVMYKLCYYRMGEITGNRDFARNQEIGAPELKLQYFDEAFTTENWIVRIYKVRKPANRAPLLNGLSGSFSLPKVKAIAGGEEATTTPSKKGTKGTGGSKATKTTKTSSTTKTVEAPRATRSSSSSTTTSSTSTTTTTKKKNSKKAAKKAGEKDAAKEKDKTAAGAPVSTKASKREKKSSTETSTTTRTATRTAAEKKAAAKDKTAKNSPEKKKKKKKTKK
ncbi:unnamed protein product [Amoebophrya sp. A120]|nr:unnamed protein product [Amoebophrya sp. A120]|eukprot:GSA120T00016602001.1